MEFASLDQVIAKMQSLGATEFYCKHLAENDNSKQQIYLGGSFDILRQLPFEAIVAGEVTAKRQAFKAQVNLYWIDEYGHACLAPGSQLILYPDYPEVRLSGFLRGCPVAPNEWMRPIPKDRRRFNNSTDGRVILFGVAGDRILAYLALAGSVVAGALYRDSPREGRGGPLTPVSLGRSIDSRAALLGAMSKIVRHWHPSRRLNKFGASVPYAASNGGGYTLEALVGVIPNGRSEPDFLGWELKAISGKRVTLMTPEPTGGIYREQGAKDFVRRYGAGVREDGAQYFTGTHRWGAEGARSGLTLMISGFDSLNEKINVSSGGIQLVDREGRLAAEWGYAGLIEHWARKHAAAAYIRYEASAGSVPLYRYNSPIMLGSGSTFDRFLKTVVSGKIVFDPGSKVDARDVVKARSQFRIAERDLPLLYGTWEEADV
jgi:hypothetical protein